MVSKPTVVFVHGAWHTSECFSDVAKSLQGHGYHTVGVDLPSVGNPDTITSNEPDVEAVRTAIKKACDANQDVLLFMHSYGGSPGSSAVRGLTKKDREEQGKPGGVKQLVFCCAWMLNEGDNILQGTNRQVANNPHDVLKGIGGPHALYSDLDEETQNHWVSKLQHQSFTALYHSKITYAAWRDVPTTYILCQQDKAIPIARQEKLVSDARAKGANIRTEWLDASHSPFLSQPEAVVAAVRRAAGEDV